MHRNTIWAGVAVVLAVSVNRAHCEQPAFKNFVVLPITSELEELLVGAFDVYVEINGNAIVEDETLLPERLDIDRFRAVLFRLKKGTDTDRTIALYVRFAGVDASDEALERLKAKITGICREAGYPKVRIGWRYESRGWNDKLARLEQTQARDADSPKPSVSNHELVRIFAVRTPLARFVLGNVDCYVDLRQPIDGRFKAFPKSIREQIVESVASFELPSKNAIMFRFLATTAGREVGREYFGFNGQSGGSIFANEMGFERCLYSMTAMGVGPEELLGKEAPDFTLESLTGEQLNLHTAIQGRVAVIAFWGVACGGCRVEAPHLTTLHNRYPQSELAVIAVNGYNESKEIVSKYVQEEGLTHPVALMGRDVAKEKYTVVSYPVTFLVDHNGAMTDYHLGFESGDEQRLFAKVAQMLRERNDALAR